MSGEVALALGMPLPADIPDPVRFGPRAWLPGIQALWRFPNGYGASVVLGLGSYGVELAAIRYDGPAHEDYAVDYDNPVTGEDVLGHLTPAALVDALRAIQRLPAPLAALDDDE